MSKAGIVNVRMVITEEKILSNIDKVQKIINPKSKKQIVKLDEDTYFKDMIEAIKVYLIEYPNKKNFPSEVYKATYGLVEYAINQFEENTKKIEDLIMQREANIGLANDLRSIVGVIENNGDKYTEELEDIKDQLTDELINTLDILAYSEDEESEEYTSAAKIINARISNLESNLHIEIDMERVSDKSKALSYIGIEVAEALKCIPAPIQDIVEEPAEEVIVQKAVKKEKIEKVEVQVAEEVNNELVKEEANETTEAVYQENTTFEVKTSFWQKIKNSKIVRAIRFVTKIKVKLEYPALPEGRGEC